MKTANLLMAMGLVALVSMAEAANPPATVTMVPPWINYQGRLVTPAGVAYSNYNHRIILSIWNAASGGTKIWSEEYTVPTRDGYFSVNLGSGGAPRLTTTNVPLAQILWSFAGVSPETNGLYMGLTVLTGPDTIVLNSPLESTPRQQFMTTPFAFRAQQSAYARKADGLFDAASGVQTPTISATNLAVSAVSNVTVTARTLDLALSSSTPTNAFTVSGRPMFVRQQARAIASTSSTRTYINHDIDSNYYDTFVTGFWSTCDVAPIAVYPLSTSIAVDYPFSMPAGETVQVWILGVRKNVVHDLPFKNNTN